jgi:hypothetical protein
MSTRCHIGIFSKKPLEENVKKPNILLYRHCDGCPFYDVDFYYTIHPMLLMYMI